MWTDVASRKLYRCVAELKTKAEFEDGCGPSNRARSRGVGSGEGAIGPPTLQPWPNLVMQPV